MDHLPARARTATTLAYYAGFVALGLTSAVLGAALPRLASHTNSTTAQISFLFTTTSLGYLIGSSQIGRWYDRRPGHPLAGGALIVLAALIAAVPLIRSLWLLLAISLCIGIAQGVLDVGGNTLLVWIHGAKVGPFMNGLHLFFGIGAFVSPVIVAQVLSLTGDVNWAYWLIAALLVPVAVWLSRLPSPSGAQSNDCDRQRNTPAWVIALFAVFFFLFVGAEHTLGGWTATYAVGIGLGSETTAAYLTSAFWGAFTLGRLVAIPLTAYIRPRWILIGDIVICILSVTAMLLWPGSPIAVWAGVIGAGFGIAPIFATTMALAETMLSITGQVTSWFFIGVSSGSLIMPWLIGQLFDAVGPRVLIYAELADLALGLCILLILLSSTRAHVRRPVDSPAAPAVHP